MDRWSSKGSEAQMPILGKDVLDLHPDLRRMALDGIERLPWCLKRDSCHDKRWMLHGTAMRRSLRTFRREMDVRFIVSRLLGTCRMDQ